MARGAEIGDVIAWDGLCGYPEELRVGHGYRLDRLVNGMTPQEWADDYASNGPEARLEDRLSEGEISEAEFLDALSIVQAAARRQEQALFGDVMAELDEYARELARVGMAHS